MNKYEARLRIAAENRGGNRYNLRKIAPKEIDTRSERGGYWWNLNSWSKHCREGILDCCLFRMERLFHHVYRYKAESMNIQSHSHGEVRHSHPNLKSRSDTSTHQRCNVADKCNLGIFTWRGDEKCFCFKRKSQPPASLLWTSLDTVRRSDNTYSDTVFLRRRNAVHIVSQSGIMENSPSTEMAGSMQYMAATDSFTEEPEKTETLMNPTELATSEENNLTTQLDFFQQKIDANEGGARTPKCKSSCSATSSVEVNDSLSYVEVKHSWRTASPSCLPQEFSSQSNHHAQRRSPTASEEID